MWKERHYVKLDAHGVDEEPQPKRRAKAHVQRGSNVRDTVAVH